jgi:DNA-binding Xre family transcriptional regulator
VAVRFRLREVLEGAGVNQSEASRLSRVSFATINRMCTNATRRVDLDIINELCQTLHVKPGDLFEYVPEKRMRRGESR